MSDSYRIFPLGDSALTVEFGNEISIELNDRAIALSNYFQFHPFAGFIETVPAYASTTIFFNSAKVRDSFPTSSTAFDAVRTLTEAAIKDAAEMDNTEARTVEIPIHFDRASALDLQFVAESHGLKPADVIEIFTSRIYRVFMLGFLPGFTYLAEVDGRIATPRKDAPRTLVPKGSVGVAGRQTGVYSLDSPGGWQIIGRTDVEMFTPGGERPTLLSPGERVKFVSAK
jgi:inhibitor of KinA